MKTSGWIFLACSLTFVWGLAAWCYSRVLGGGERPRDDS